MLHQTGEYSREYPHWVNTQTFQHLEGASGILIKVNYFIRIIELVAALYFRALLWEATMLPSIITSRMSSVNASQRRRLAFVEKPVSSNGKWWTHRRENIIFVNELDSIGSARSVPVWARASPSVPSPDMPLMSILILVLFYVWFHSCTYINAVAAFKITASATISRKRRACFSVLPINGLHKIADIVSAFLSIAIHACEKGTENGEQKAQSEMMISCLLWISNWLLVIDELRNYSLGNKDIYQ